MNRYDLEPNKENIIRTLRDNVFNRNQYIRKFYKLLLYADGIESIAVDGEWGTGKTFFARQLQYVINSNNSFFKSNEKCPIEIENPDETMFSVYYDAWKNDNDIDPIISILYEITKQLNLEFDFESSEDKINKLLNIIGIVSEKLQKKANGLLEILKKNKKINEIENERNIEEEISNFILGIQNEKCNKLVVFIDELDRCNPLYAVKLLERIKHYLINEKVIFVFMINSKELQYSIQQCYGSNFDAYRYLDRFFNLRLQLPKISDDQLFEQIHLFKYASSEIAKSVINYYNMTAREIMHYKVLCDIVQNKYIKQKSKIEHYLKTTDILLSQYLAPLFIGLYLNDIDVYYKTVNGNDSEVFADIFEKVNLHDEIPEKLLDRNSESYDNIQGKKKVTLRQKSLDLYNLIFGKFDSLERPKMIGEYQISKKTKSELLDIISLLSEISDFEGNES